MERALPFLFCFSPARRRSLPRSGSLPQRGGGAAPEERHRRGRKRKNGQLGGRTTKKKKTKTKKNQKQKKRTNIMQHNGLNLVGISRQEILPPTGGVSPTGEVEEG